MPRLQLAFATAYVAWSIFCFVDASPVRADELLSRPRPASSVTLLSPATEICPVSDPTPAPVTPLPLSYLAEQFDFAGADLGYSVFDPRWNIMWFFFGDSLALDSVAWYDGGNADATGFVYGADAFSPKSLCTRMQMAAVPGLISTTGNAVWSPDVMTAQQGDPITNYSFLGLSSNGGLPFFPSANSKIPGVDEVVTGAFFSVQNLDPFAPEAGAYIFYSGSPGFKINRDAQGHAVLPLGLPLPSVSYLSLWRNPSPFARFGTSPTSFDVVARVDYNLENDVTTCPLQYPGTLCPPTPPAGWAVAAPTPPLGGHFIQVSPEWGDDGYLYFFGAGTYRASRIYLARLPQKQIDLLGKCPKAPCYLSLTPGFQIWTTTVPSGTPHWSTAVATPSQQDIDNAAPLQFGDDATADYGELSVRRYAFGGGSDVWLMMATSVLNPDFRAQVLARWAPSPTGPWSNAIVAFDFSGDAIGTQNRARYCCQGAWTGKSNAGGKVWQCLKPPAASAQQFVECEDQSASQTVGTPGAPRFGFYAAYLLPFPTEASQRAETVNGVSSLVSDFTVSFLISEFSPYNAVLMQYRAEAVWPR